MSVPRPTTTQRSPWLKTARSCSRTPAMSCPLAKATKTIAVIGRPASQREQMGRTGEVGAPTFPRLGSHMSLLPFRPFDKWPPSATTLSSTTMAATSHQRLRPRSQRSVAVVFADDAEGETQDEPNLNLRAGACTFVCAYSNEDQDTLIAAVARANPHTIVVLDSGGPVLMPWISQVKGIVEAWYPGQQDGNAIAAILFGSVDPSGKLPETFPASESQLPTNTVAQFPGVNNQEAYSEGLLIGYRWYDTKHIHRSFRLATAFPTRASLCRISRSEEIGWCAAHVHGA